VGAVRRPAGDLKVNQYPVQADSLDPFGDDTSDIDCVEIKTNLNRVEASM